MCVGFAFKTVNSVRGESSLNKIFLAFAPLSKACLLKQALDSGWMSEVFCGKLTSTSDRA